VVCFSRGALAARAALYVEGPHATSVMHDVGAALSPHADARPSGALEAAVHAALAGTPLSRALSTRDGAHAVAAAARASFEHSGADLAVVVALPASDATDRSVEILLVPRRRGAPALLQSAAFPVLDSIKARVAWWSQTFRMPETPPTNVDEEPAAAGVAAAEAPSVSPGSDELLGDSPYQSALSESARAATGDGARPEGAGTGRANAQVQSSGGKNATTDIAVPNPGRHPSRPPRYVVRVAFEMSVRDFEDAETGPGAARTYHAFPIPALAVGAEAYPLFGVLGFSGSFAQSLGFSSMTSDRTLVGTTFQRAEGALEGRIPFASEGEAPWLALLAGYGYTRFVFDAAPAGREIPTAIYQALRFGAKARIPVGRVHFTGGAEFDHLLSIAKLGTSRARAPGNGVTATLGAAFALTPWLLIGLDARYTWLTYAFVRTPSATATDQYVTYALAMDVLF
jgi:hypothetical protein